MKTIKDPKAPTGEHLQNTWDEGCSDTRKVLENMYPDFFEKEEEIYRRGSRLEIGGNECIVAALGEKKHVVICLSDGTRHGEPFHTEDWHRITDSEIKKAVSSEFKKYTK